LAWLAALSGTPAELTVRRACPVGPGGSGWTVRYEPVAAIRLTHCAEMIGKGRRVIGGLRGCIPVHPGAYGAAVESRLARYRLR